MSGDKLGTLYGVGVGPGDPKLLTIRALEVIREVGVVFAASSPKNGYSLALQTVQEHLPASTRVERLPFPMTDDRAALERAWQENAGAVLAVLEQGEDAAFLTIGDPLTYSTYGYLLRTLGRMHPGLRAETVPGITAYHAAAARLNLPLVESKESLLVVSGVGEAGEISRLAEFGDNLVIMKAYRNFDRIMETLQDLPRPRRVAAASLVGLPGERLEPDARRLEGGKVPYLTLLLVKKAGEE